MSNISLTGIHAPDWSGRFFLHSIPMAKKKLVALELAKFIHFRLSIIYYRKNVLQHKTTANIIS